MTKLCREILRTSNRVEDIVSDIELDAVWRNANFGGIDRREVVRVGVLKCLTGYHQGYTSKTICTELGLISHKYRVTAKGRAYLYLAFKGDSNL